MARKKNVLDQLLAERYFVWAIVFAVVVSGGLLAQISIAQIQLDSEAMTTSYLTVPHTTHTSQHIYRNK